MRTQRKRGCQKSEMVHVQYYWSGPLVSGMLAGLSFHHFSFVGVAFFFSVEFDQSYSHCFHTRMPTPRPFTFLPILLQNFQLPSLLSSFQSWRMAFGILNRNCLQILFTNIPSIILSASHANNILASTMIWTEINRRQRNDHSWIGNRVPPRPHPDPAYSRGDERQLLKSLLVTTTIFSPKKGKIK